MSIFTFQKVERTRSIHQKKKKHALFEWSKYFAIKGKGNGHIKDEMDYLFIMKEMGQSACNHMLDECFPLFVKILL